ncbi:MAG: methyltransferase domain-containing protein [Pseudomonadales bacterium]|jgi:SAM-dependent methyltransferase|tara:strand:+ start:7788 stop:8762 length:975 start_codon:yes stop_codon:yes gene_type:complete
MSDSIFDSPARANEWDRYWRGSSSANAYSAGGSKHPVLQQFWRELFMASLSEYPQGRMIDLCGGSGAVLSAAEGLSVSEGTELISLDISVSALALVVQNYPYVQTIAADAAHIPLESKTMDLVSSQFGIEYAGEQAMSEVARLPRKGGKLALVLHHSDGLIQQECASSADAIQRLIDSDLISMALDMFEKGYSMLRGAGSDEFHSAARAVNPVYRSLEPIMDEHGVHVAGETIATLYNRIAEIQKNLPRYEETEVIGWLEAMASELPAYADRMVAMCQSGQSPEQFKSFCAHLSQMNYRIQQAHPQQIADTTLPLAWMLVAERS